jgi:hypothetical protein
MDVGKIYTNGRSILFSTINRPRTFDFTIKLLESWLALLDRDSRLSAIYTSPACIVRCYGKQT